MLKLIIGEEGEMVQSATIPVRWCVDKSTLEKLKQINVADPHILIVVAHRDFENDYYRETSRQIAPLKQLVEYVQFLKPGKNTIFATIVWTESDWTESDGISLWKKYLSKENGKYQTDLICDYIHKRESVFSRPHYSFEEVAIDVEVPVELFAREYPKWLQKWVNFWYETKPKDQCHFRRRMIPAFTIQPPLILLGFIAKSLLAFAITLVLLLSGTRGINFRVMFQLWKKDLSDIWCNSKGSIFSRKWKDKRGKEHQIWFLLPLAPIYFVAFFLITYVVEVSWLQKQHTNFERLIVIGITVGFTVVYAGIWDLSIYLFVQLRILLKSLIEALKPTSLPKPKPLPKPESPIISYGTEQFLLCDGNLSTNIRDLPPKRRTVYLRFQDLKAKVCKPLPQ